MPVSLSVVANCDDALIFWKAEKPIPECRGFAVERERRNSDATVHRQFLVNRMGFEKDDPRPGDVRPSTEWPFQRFSWTDHEVDAGDRVRYRVVPIVHDGAALAQALDERSAWSRWVELSGEAGDRTSAFFNRGLVISQFMARYLERLRLDRGLDTTREALTEFKKSLAEHELPIRRFLSGNLRTELLGLIAEANEKKHHVFGALYELEDEEIVAALGSLGARGHLVLANGSIQAKKGEPREKARKRDQNKAARTVLRKRKLEIHNRMISPGALGHNKFLVVTDKRQKPISVWTGSTNLTTTGLCTQINNALLVRDARLAAIFLEQWQRLRDAKSEFPAELVAENSKAKRVKVGHSSLDVWFTKTSKKVDLAALEALVGRAKEAVLFLMFQPGNVGTLSAIRKLLVKPAASKLYVKGVVSTLPPESEETEEHAEVTVVGDGRRRHLDLDIVQPEGFKAPFASWAATITRNDFIPTQGGVVGFAIVHSKLIVIDPFTDPVVVTGSHNFSKSASANNDENFVVVRDNPTLAREYAAHILGVYQHYRWLSFVRDQQAQERNPKGTLLDADTWQKRHLQGAPRRELDFWVR
jgi:phosphatidylserine/phosphatidylglycerophosphate/cardiolipin synthase-like enzyme